MNGKAPKGKPVTVAEALELAVTEHRNGNLKLADDVYGQVIQAFPDQPDALHFRGVLKHQLGETDAAIELLRRSIELKPYHADFHINVGNVMTSLGRCDEGVQSYDRAIALRPESADAHCNRGVALRALRREPEAEASYRESIKRAPNHAPAHNNLGNLLIDVGRNEEACESFEKALALHADFGKSFELLAKTQWRMGQRDNAIKTLRRWKRVAPENPVAAHLLVAYEGKDAPPRAADSYVKEMFDEFATSFDTALERLGYQAPKLVADALQTMIGKAEPTRAILDAGCGTGLSGPLLRDYAQSLLGVDLSPRMLDNARRLDVYDELVEAELTSYLASRSGVFDVIASSDTLCYFGELEELLAAAAGALTPGGSLVFTVEKATSDEAPSGHLLRYHGRYAHTRTYVEQQLENAGLEPTYLAEEVLRSERGQPVDGFVFGARAGAKSK